MGIPLYYQAHEGQQRIHDSDARFRVVCCGRRWGKTLALAADILEAAGNVPGDYGWIAPTYFTAERGVEAIREIAGPHVTITGRNPVRAEVPGINGMGRILFLSADNPQSILGLGFQGIVVDEAARIPLDVWTYTIRPTLSQTMGWATLISTPNGRGWFYDMHSRGNDSAESEYESFHFPSRTNPFFPAEEWEEARRTMPSDVFRQEYEAEFLEDSAGVFHGVDDCTFEGEGVRSGEVAIGCDLAKHTDFTVMIEMDRKTGVCTRMDRFNQLEWGVQKERIVGFWQQTHGLLVPDGTGVGDAVVDDLKLVVPNIAPLKFTSATKTQLIQRLIVSIEQGQVSWPKSWAVLTDELKRYEYKITASGSITYNAPGGYHDDCVIALALANSERFQFKWSGGMNLTTGRRGERPLQAGGRPLVFG